MSGHLRIRAARSPQTKSLDTFDFNAQPLLNKTLILEPAWYEWIEQRQTASRLGHPAPVRPTSASHWDWLHRTWTH
jgi:hypothetical protein